MRPTFPSKPLKVIYSYFKKQAQDTTPEPSLWRYFFQKLINAMPSIGALTIFVLLLLGLIPVLTESKENLPNSAALWASVTIVVLFFYSLLKAFELAQRSTEIEEQKKMDRHIREIQWEEVKKNQRLEIEERGIRIATACKELLESPRFERASPEDARLMLIQIFRDDAAVDEFIKYSSLAKFRSNGVGHAKEDYVVLSSKDDAITVQDIRSIYAAFGKRFITSLFVLKKWADVYPKGQENLTDECKRIAREKMVNLIIETFKGVEPISGNFTKHFDHVFLGKAK